MASYLLPFHPSITSKDPLGLHEGENDGIISQAEVLGKLLRNAQITLAENATTGTRIFINLLEDLAYTIHGDGNLNTTTLKSLLTNKLSQESAKVAIQNIIKYALQLEAPESPRELSYLTKNNNKVQIKTDITNCLLAHQTLGTLRIPKGNTWGLPGFLSWYRDCPHHPDAVNGYLQNLFTYFEEPFENTSDFSFHLHDARTMPDPSKCDHEPSIVMEIVDEIYEPSSSANNITPFILVAANKEPGPGPTGTQEERLQAASLALTMSSLLCPVIPEDAAIITSTVPVLSSWAGHNRTARLVQIFDKEERPSRHYILVDALPLDEIDNIEEGWLPDLLVGNVEREVKKLYAAFSGASELAQKIHISSCIVEAPPWGCGAFGGNIIIKTICMMIAAGLTGVHVRLLLTKDKLEETKTLRGLQTKALAVADLWRLVTDSGCKNVEDLVALIGKY